MIQRLLQNTININLEKFPVTAIVGPRQSGKTTLAKMLKPDYRYVNLEIPAERLFAKEDPQGFLQNYRDGVIIDEVQYAPELFSYLQVMVDAHGSKGRFILTGSQNFLMMEKLSQSLAGRVAIYQLLPFASSELVNTPYTNNDWESDIVAGFYPGLRVNDIGPSLFYDSYLQTYVERDVRMIKNISNLDLFQKFIKLLAGRVGQLYNQSAMAIELGIDHKTINAWMTVLEASFITFRLKPYFENFSKRLIKSPKVYFYDVGLVSHLLGIRSVDQLNQHFAKGSLFENLVILELYKNIAGRGARPELYFWRDVSGHEIDLLLPEGNVLKVMEIKSSKTMHQDFIKNLRFLSSVADNKYQILKYLVLGNDQLQFRTDYTVLSYKHLQSML
jgi:predicted AAA+ superfamily ATPase